MTKKLAVRGLPARRGATRRNVMEFPRELRDAIPDLHAGRILELDSISGTASNLSILGPPIDLKLVVKETGKLKGQFVIRMSLHPEEARKLGATLTELADQVEPAKPSEE
jgi:hypothetical protein